MADLLPVHNPVNATGKPRLVFIHGLDGDLRKTWMADAKDASTLWPRWVGQDTGCPVWLLGYGAAMSRWKADAMALPRQATAVIERLSNEPGLGEGPLVLVGHSLGGLVIKMALQQGMQRLVARHENLARSIRGIAFVGTPHFGSRLATIAAWAHFMRANPQVSNLRLDDAYLENLNQHFLALCKELDLKTRIFTETHPVRLPWWLGGRFLPGVTIVSPGSSQAHIPGEVGIPIEANHINICKPKDRSSAIHCSLVAFVKDVEAATRPLQSKTSSSMIPLASATFDAMLPEDRPSTAVHLAFSTFGVDLDGSNDCPVCATVCLVSDAPQRLKLQLEQIREAIRSDPLLDAKAKRRADSASLHELAESPGTRAVVLRQLAAISFSAYLYYCPKDSFDRLTREERSGALLVAPLLHRLSKKGEHFEQVHTRLEHIAEYLKQAADAVHETYGRRPRTPKPGAAKYSVLEELALLITTASCRHLADLSDGEATELFESLRTRIRYAENVATGEKHKRDANPLP
jgi:pimeloyl-ACP methyl ester carboxylesterase